MATMRELRKKYREPIKRFGHHVEIKNYGRGHHQVELKVGVQHFKVGPDYGTNAEAAWFRIMLLNALANLKPKKV